MIKYHLKCENNHEFESWFADSKEFEKLNNRKLLECIFCNSKKVSKTIMAPMISISKKKIIMNTKFMTRFKYERQKLTKLRSYIEKNFEYVGKDFKKK